MSHATGALPSFQTHRLSIMMPRAEPKVFLFVLEKHFPFDLLSLLVCFIFPPVSRDLFLIIQLFDNKSFLPMMRSFSLNITFRYVTCSLSKK